MEEEESLADAEAGAAPVVVQVQRTMLMPSPSPLQPTQRQDAAVLHHSTVSTESGSRSSEPALAAAEQTTPMDIEEDLRQPQPQPRQHPHFWSG